MAFIEWCIYVSQSVESGHTASSSAVDCTKSPLNAARPMNESVAECVPDLPQLGTESKRGSFHDGLQLPATTEL